MEKINKNIRFLRNRANLTQRELALKLNVKSPVIGSYEEGRSIPPVPISIKIAELFSISLDDLLLKDFSEKSQFSTISKEILTITVNSNGEENVEFVSHKASAGYISEYSDPNYVTELPKISIPFLSKAKTHRAFEITGLSMLPVNSGDIIIGKFTYSIDKVKAGKTYVFVTKSNGVIYKRIFELLPNHIILISDNPDYDPFLISLDEVLEVWEFVMRLTKEEEKSELRLKYIEQIIKLKNTHGQTI